ncbi:MAG: tRNA (guanosine(37)-N1)-methyltransferase TrmD [Defluviitaleaceae bacterium]|nr:tRNA (guanosine(37)-N1)-methyltransferase TrmD [Defluviitaleaceae bacterium]MCL2240015.1 tRNA (guanosine(37)-N1)-methyltransferase TrmD [Defluviitaleaceae bacterium]
MTFHVLTLFPDMITQMVSHSILGRGISSGYICVNAVNIRDFAVNKHGQVDDAPYGGGAGMVLMAPPVYDAWNTVAGEFAVDTDLATCTRYAVPCSAGDAENLRVNALRGTSQSRSLQLPNPCPSTPSPSPPRTIYLSPQGRVFTQALARELARERELILLCGHYEGIDQRVLEEIVTDEISIGDYVLTGGEPAALVLMDAVSRLVPGVLGKEASHEDESFGENLGGGLEYPHYTRPPVFRGREVPEVLLSGHHGKIEAWRREQSRERTRKKRPDLMKYSRIK